MRSRGVKFLPVRKAIFDRDVVPAKNLEWIQMIHDRKGIKFVQARHHAAILYIRQPANMQDQL